jgi:hypothetical protein
VWEEEEEEGIPLKGEEAAAGFLPLATTSEAKEVAVRVFVSVPKAALPSR